MLPIVRDIGDEDGTIGFFNVNPKYVVERFMGYSFKKGSVRRHYVGDDVEQMLRV